MAESRLNMTIRVRRLWLVRAMAVLNFLFSQDEDRAAAFGAKFAKIEIVPDGRTHFTA